MAYVTFYMYEHLIIKYRTWTFIYKCVKCRQI